MLERERLNYEKLEIVYKKGKKEKEEQKDCDGEL
jgi:hypothetical protein